MKLKTTVEAQIGGKQCGTYTVALHKSERTNSTVLRIIPRAGTGGYWDWYLSTLLLDGCASDILSLDFGQKWQVSGMLDVYREILNDMELRT